MKHIVLFLSLLVITLSTKSVLANNKFLDAKDKIAKELQYEIRLAEADMDEDEELFSDDAEDTNSGGDWAEEESLDGDVAETTPTPSPEPMEEIAEEPAPKPMPNPVKKHIPTPPKKTPNKPVAKKVQPKVQAKNPVGNSRVPASFKQGFKVSKTSCGLHSEPNNGSSVILTTGSGKKLWLETANKGWYKGYHKDGFGYFPANCFK
ncbi:MAG: hypothetical protein H6625_13815 [Bdellovibrionaceae bacterium]|nr:hypothetical protein [Pseudobdellovibrionaceae bacterium]